MVKQKSICHIIGKLGVRNHDDSRAICGRESKIAKLTVISGRRNGTLFLRYTNHSNTSQSRTAVSSCMQKGSDSFSSKGVMQPEQKLEEILEFKKRLIGFT